MKTHLGRILVVGLGMFLMFIGSAQADTFTLGTSALLEAPAAGTDSVVLAVSPITDTWTATTNALWLHLSAANQSGAGSTNVIFTYDANSGSTRTGTLTIAGQTLTVTQAGATYIAAPIPVTALVASGLSGPNRVAMDGVGNVYIADMGNHAVKEWKAANSNVTTIVTAGLSGPAGVAVDGTGNVYIADYANKAIYEWSVANSNLTTLVSTGLSIPVGVTVDGAGNVYIADVGNNTIKKWAMANSNVTTLVSSGLSGPNDVSVDVAGNVYIADQGHSAVKKWAVANSNVTTLVSGALAGGAAGVALDGAGNLFIATGNALNGITKWTAANSNVTTLVSTGLSRPGGVAVDGTGNVYIADYGNNAIKELPRAFLDPTGRTETAVAGSDSLPVVLPATENLFGVFAPTNNQPWLTIAGITNGVVSFAFTANISLTNRMANITLLGQNIAITQTTPTYSLSTNNVLEGFPAGSDNIVLTVAPTNGAWTATNNATWLHLSAANQIGAGSTNVVFTFDANPNATSRTGTLTIGGQTLTVNQMAAPFSSVLGATNLLESSSSGSDSVVLAANDAWTATANVSWLHLSAANQSGTGSTNVIFTFDANPGATRTGSLTIAGQTLAVTQAGTTYVAAPAPVTALVLSSPQGVAVDGVGNVYFSDAGNNAIKEWTPASNAVTTLVSSGLNYPTALASDASGNLYFIDGNNTAIKKWTAASNAVSSMLTSQIRLGGVAVDVAGNVVFCDEYNYRIKECQAGSTNVITLASVLMPYPVGVAVDIADNIYINNGTAILESMGASNTVSTLVSSGLNSLGGVAVDGSGNVYIADSSHYAIKKWTAANKTVSTLAASIPIYASSITVDGSGNVFFANLYNGTNSLSELPHAFVDPTSKVEGPAAGSDTLPVVLPATQNLLAPFAPTSDQSWLTIGGVTNGVVSFSFAAFPVSPRYAQRTANITLLGTNISVTQYQVPAYGLAATALLEGPAAGADSVVLSAIPVTIAPWTATNNVSWLHLSVTNQSGTGSTIVIFNYDANPGATRTGSLTIAGQTLTVTQAGSSYVAAPGPVTPLVSSGLNSPRGVAVDGAGNVYVADTYNNVIKEWSFASSNVTTLAISSYIILTLPLGVAVDGAGNVYVADTFYNFGPYSPILGWMPANSNFIFFAYSDITHPDSVTVDGACNVYAATLDWSIVKWTAGSNSVASMGLSGLNNPSGVAVDGSGNIYIADTGNNAIKEWTAANGNVTTLVSSGLSSPNGVAVDNAGNVYIADSGNSTIEELPKAFVDPTVKTESPAAGSDVLPVVLPASANLTGPFAPVSDSAWLTITGITSGVVSFAFAANTGSSNRTANITLLGQAIPVIQSAIVLPMLSGTAMLGDGTFNFTWSAVSNQTYQLQYTVDLTTTNWIDLGSPVTATSNSVSTSDLPGADQQRFYRVRLWP